MCLIISFEIRWWGLPGCVEALWWAKCDQTCHVILPVRKWGFVTPEAKRLSITRDEGNAFFQGADGPMYM